MPKPYFGSSESKLDEIVRVNHAGEYGAKRICEGQWRYLKSSDKEVVRTMLMQEMRHLRYFEEVIKQNHIRPTFLSPLWNICGYFLGAIPAMISTEYAMIVTSAIEEVIETHYQEQLLKLQDYPEHEKLSRQIQEFCAEESEHKDTASSYVQLDSSSKRLVYDIVKEFCKIAINLSKKI
jgi:ubiquinone biosynthesis monooxygenase Coq7